ncbi:hypothetical protein M1555_03795 [Patescibacteria group bacterium]|nr:hypothetical protein [Patescibacteria group bacterium]
MTTYSIIKKSQLEGAQRIDSEYYQPEYLEIAKKLQSIPHQTLEDISESLISFGAYDLTNYIEWVEDGIPFIEANNIKEGYIDYNDVKFIDNRSDEILKKSRVYEGQVLLAMSGSVGNAAMALNIPQKLNSNQDIVKISLKPNYSALMIAMFLNSKYGKKQVLRLPVGSVQQHIFLWQTKTILIPTFLENEVKEVESLYKESLRMTDVSKKSYADAENLLLDELELKNLQFSDDLSYVINFSDSTKTNRIDADYFQPKYEVLESELKKRGAKTLKKTIFDVPANFKPGEKPDETFKYVELANINASIGVVDGYEEVSGKEAPGRAKRLLKAGDVIVSSVEGSLEKVALIDEEQDGYIASTGFFQFRSDEVLPEVLLVMARSLIMQKQLKKRCAGTILTAVPQESIDNMLIPVLAESTQQKIADLVRQSHEARKKSKELLEEAKRKVEEMIEKGGQENEKTN